jgi:hypothetical protein
MTRLLLGSTTAVLLILAGQVACSAGPGKSGDGDSGDGDGDINPGDGDSPSRTSSIRAAATS